MSNGPPEKKIVVQSMVSENRGGYIQGRQQKKSTASKHVDQYHSLLLTLRDVLVQRVGQVRLSIDVSPIEVVGKLILRNVGMRKRGMIILTDVVCFEDHVLIVAAKSDRDRGEQ